MVDQLYVHIAYEGRLSQEDLAGKIAAERRHASISGAVNTAHVVVDRVRSVSVVLKARLGSANDGHSSRPQRLADHRHL